MESEGTEIPITFEAGAFDEGFSEVDFAARQKLADDATDVAQTLDPVNYDAMAFAGSATFTGLMQLDYNGYVSGNSGETYLVASALGKMELTANFSTFNGDNYVEFNGTADSFVRNDNVPLTGEYELEWQGPMTTDELTGRSEDFVVYMDGRLGVGDTRYSGDANMYFDASGESGEYLSGRIGGELQIWDVNSPTDGTIYGNTTGHVVANKN